MKGLSIFLALTLFAGSIAGCTGDSTPPSDKDVSDDTTNEIVQPEQESPESETDSENPEGEEKQMLKYLNNTYYKLTHDKSLNIAFAGGSVTDGYGSSDQSTKSWAYLTTQWFKAKFPDAKVNGTKVSIGGTGSYLADFRFEREIKTKNPDLFFIEFAVNDKYNGVSYDSVVRTSETLVQKAYAANPNMDIVYILTFDSGTGTADYDQLKAHRDVAEKYGLMCIKLSDHVYSMLEETGEEFSEYYKDGVHPNDKGYEYYASVITEYIGNDIIAGEGKEIGEVLLKAAVLPEENLSKEPLLLDANMVYANELKLIDATGWDFQQTGFSWLGMRYNGRIFADSVGEKFTYEFDGTDFGICYGIGPDMGTITCTVDGGEPVVINAYRGNKNPKEGIVAWNLEKGKHTVTVEVTAANENGKAEFEIGALLIN